MAHRLMKEDGQEVAMPPKAGTTPKKKEAAKSVVAPVNEGIAWVASDQFPSDQRPGASRDNPVHLSDMLLMHQLQVRAPERMTILTMRPSYWATLAMPCVRWLPV